MAEDDTPEGWQVPHRPAVIAAAATPVALALLLLLAGRFYTGDLKPQTRQRVHAFPAPGIETYIHDGLRDPERPAPRPRPDPRIEAAKRDIARAGWNTPQ